MQKCIFKIDKLRPQFFKIMFYIFLYRNYYLMNGKVGLIETE